MAQGKFVAYYRVSTEKQGRSGLGLEAQRKAVEDYLNGGNWHIAAEVVEIESGKRNDRPKLAEALRLCRLHGAVLYEGPGYPYAVEEPGGVVTGCLVTARPEAYPTLLAELDRLEGYAPGDPDNLYERLARDVERTSGGTVRAWVYVAAPRVTARLRAHGTRIDSGDWVDGR